MSVHEHIHYYYGAKFGINILTQTKNLSKALQDPLLSASEAQACAKPIVELFMSQCSVEKFKLFLDNLLNMKRTEIEDPKLGRKRKTQEFFGKQVGSAYYPKTPEQKYNDAYNNAYDYAIT